jgi:hypothetical protein
VGRVSPFTKSYLLEAHPVSLTKTLFTIGFDPEFADHLGLVDNSKNRTLIQTKLQELGCGEIQIKFIKAEAPAGWSKPAPQAEPAVAEIPATTPPVAARPPAVAEVKKEKSEAIALSKEDFKNDPLIKQALEIFKGTIIEVRA